MDKIVKKTGKFTIGVLCLGMMSLFVAYGCNKLETSPSEESSMQEEQEKIVIRDSCEFENPLTDLPWLKTIIDENARLAQEGKYPTTYIYQYMYDSGKTGFLEDLGNIAKFYNCEGKCLCITGGIMGTTFPPELKIDFANRKLIWKVENGFINDSCEFDNPLTDLPWLKKKVEDFISYSNSVSKRHFQIYQCTYMEEGNEKIGFIVTPICIGVECVDIARLYKCTGFSLCNMGGIFGDCNEFNIANKSLIWEINN